MYVYAFANQNGAGAVLAERRDRHDVVGFSLALAETGVARGAARDDGRVLLRHQLASRKRSHPRRLLRSGGSMLFLTVFSSGPVPGAALTSRAPSHSRCLYSC